MSAHTTMLCWSTSTFIFGILCLVADSSSKPECPIVSCKNGKVSGIVTKANHGDAKFIFSYHAIPFAEPPIGARRFKKTTPLGRKWEGILDGSTPKNAPLSEEAIAPALASAFLPPKANHKFTYNEDCLNLNVYTPNVSESANLPVLVWICGGGFGLGNNQLYDGTALAGLENVVVVVPNYRVNVFGFLSFGANSLVSGNVGLHDQYLAFKWVKRNIRNFGGDRNNVLAFGQSAGSVSVGHHLYSPSFKGLFHKAIYFSGVASTLLTLNDENVRVQQTQKLFKKLGVNETNNNDILRQLQAVDGMDLVRAVAELQAEGTIFYPVVDGRIIEKDPQVVLENGGFRKVPTMVINTDNEGMGLMGLFIPGFAAGIPEAMLKAIIAPMFKEFKPSGNFDAMYAKLKERYLKYFPNDQFFFSKMYGRFFGELYFYYPSLAHALKQTESMNLTYVGIGEFQLKLFHGDDFGDGLPIKPEWVNCDHGEDIFMTLGVPFIDAEYQFNPQFTEEEKALSLKYMRFIANFARNGNPNDKGLESWKPFSAANRNIMKIGLTSETLKQETFDDVVQFWSQDFI